MSRLVALVAALVIAAGCASQPESTVEAAQGGEGVVVSGTFLEVDDENDPLETLNRLIFAVNLALDTLIIKPVAVTYRFFLPAPVRDSLRNFLRNLRSPVILANDLMQGEVDRFGTTLVRFSVNSTIGLLGLLDVATDMGYPFHDEDFGQTLGVHGVGEGAYLVLPILGPSSIRDGTGIVVDIFLDPLTYVGEEYDIQEELLIRTVAAGIDKRSRLIEELDDLQRDAIDFYARIRSLYRQTRRNDIYNGQVPPSTPGPEFSGIDFDLDDETADSTQ